MPLFRAWKLFKEELLIPIMAVVCAIITGSLIVALAGFDPFKTYAALFDGAFGSKYNFSETLLKSVPYLFTGLGVAIAFRCRSFNIGAEGQFLMGALIASWVGVIGNGLPALILVPLILFLSFLAGGIYGAVPGYLKAKIGASEVVTTVMLNSIALQVISLMVQGPLQEPKGFYPETAEIADPAKLAIIMSGTRLHLGIIIGIIFAILAYVFLFKTAAGYQIRAVGSSQEAAEYAGINVKRNIILAMAISGGLAGLGGGIELTGVTWKLYQNFSPGYGYTAIAVALLAKRNPLGVILTALLFGALSTGANMMQRSAEIPAVLVSVIQALIIFFVVGFSIYEAKLKRSNPGIGHKQVTSEQEGRAANA